MVSPEKFYKAINVNFEEEYDVMVALSKISKAIWSMMMQRNRKELEKRKKLRSTKQ